MSTATGLIGDVVDSRRVPDREALQSRLVEALAGVSAETNSTLTMTVGDEFQGRLPDLESALAASLRLHLALLDIARLRIGIGVGGLSLETDAASPIGQDGPVWWRARAAIEAVAAGGDEERTRLDTGTDWDGALNAYLRLRDSVIDRFDEADAVIALGLLDGATQKEMARRLGLNQSSVSRRVNRHGIAAVVAASRFRLGPMGEES